MIEEISNAANGFHDWMFYIVKALQLTHSYGYKKKFFLKNLMEKIELFLKILCTGNTQDCV